MEHDLKKIHGSLVTKHVMSLLDTGALTKGDVILLPLLYRLRYNEQNRLDFYREASLIESYTCCQDFSCEDPF